MEITRTVIHRDGSRETTKKECKQEPRPM